MKIIFQFASVLIIYLASPLWAFNLETHAVITKEAFDRSILSGQSVASRDLYFRLGFDRLDAQHPFKFDGGTGCKFPFISNYEEDEYLDARGNWLNAPAPDLTNVVSRCPTQYEQRSMPPDYTGLLSNPSSTVGPLGWLRFEGWLMRGAIREDDFKSGFYDNPNLVPDTDPWNDSFRSSHHFYDPTTMSSGGLFTQSLLPWALGVADDPSIMTNQEPDPTRGNHFSYVDAKRAYYQALIYKRPAPTTAQFLRDDDTFRKALWATTLMSLGHVVHLLEDTAQPQHVRNESHAYLCNTNGLDFVNQPVATRTFENYTDFRVTFPFDQALANAGSGERYSFSNACDDEKWRNMFVAASASPPKNTSLWIGSGNTYPIPQFSLVRKFFTTKFEDGNINNRRGLADYTNRGFYTEGKFAGDYDSPPKDVANSPDIVIGDTRTIVVPGKGNVKLRGLYWKVPDAVSPNYPNPDLDAQGRAPIASYGFWTEVIQAPSPAYAERYAPILSLENYNQIADMTAPRAVAYSTGLINYFFRGKLDIEPIDQKVFAVLNQGEPHTVDADGYPRKPDGTIFGFEKIRLKVRNATDPIIESGTNVNVPQTVGAGTLIAVARYHRNACYKPDLSGERSQVYALSPAIGAITSPVCASGLPVRTNYQEISVSAPLTISGVADLPGGAGGTPPATIEKTFDFSLDKIPANVADLYIQLIFKGQLGEETDGIALGNIDVREPTIMTFWNNTDYYLDSSATPYLPANASFPLRAIAYFRLCIGPSTGEKLAYYFTPAQTGNAMTGPPTTGSIRIAAIVAPPTTPTDTFRIKATPVMPTAPHSPALVRTSKGRINQANKEIISAATLAAPFADCGTTTPTAAEYLCNDPLQQRRGAHLGSVLQPISWVSPNGNPFNTFDVANSMPNIASSLIQTQGEVRFNNTGVLEVCPAAPTLIAKSVSQTTMEELVSQARALGIEMDDEGNVVE
jgi:hypothetical protein